MAYDIRLSNNSELITGGLLDNTVDSANSSLTLVGKNYKSYGVFLNQNFVRLMENFALATAPTAPLPGQIWFNSTSKLLNVNVANAKGTLNAIWKTIAGMTISASTPTNAYTGEQWYDTVNGQLKLYTGTEWRLIGPLSRLATGNTGAIPDTVTDAPPSTTFVVIKFFIDNVLVGIWSKDGPFPSDVPGFATVQKGLNFNSTLGHKFYGNAFVSDNLYVNGVAVAGNNFVRNDTSSSINGSLTLTNDNGLTLGAASDFVANVLSGTVILKNQTNNRDLILSLRTSGAQTPFFRGNYLTGLAEAYQNPTAVSPALSYATKNYVDVLSGAVNGTANFFGSITPNANVQYTLGNVTNTWSNLFSQSAVIGNVYAANTFATLSNVAQIYVSADITPITSNTSNIGSIGMQFNSILARSAALSTTLTVGSNLTVGGNIVIANNSTIGGSLGVVGSLSTAATTTATSTSTGALTVAGGAGVAGNLFIGESLSSPQLHVPNTGNLTVGNNLNPSANVTYTLGNASNRWNNIFSDSVLVGNISAANIAVTRSNVATIFLGGDILPTANTSSNLGSQGIFLRAIHAQTVLVSSALTISNTGDVSANIGAYQLFANANIGTTRNNLNTLDANLALFSAYANTKIGTNSSSNLVVLATTAATTTTTGALVVAGGVGIAGNVIAGGEIRTPTLPIGTSNTAVATTAFVQATVPSGSLMMWPTASAPTGWLLCNGTAVSRTTFAALFAIIGTTFGVGDGSTTFNLPNYNNRMPIGAGGLYASGATGGTKDAVVVSHTHTLSGGGVSGTFVTGVSTNTSSFQTFGLTAVTSVSTTTGSPGYTNPTVQSAGSSGTDANLPPYLAINFIIKT
jgi:microcystin-dependent protein